MASSKAPCCPGGGKPSADCVVAEKEAVDESKSSVGGGGCCGSKAAAVGEEIRQGVKEHYSKAKKCCAYRIGKPSVNLQRQFVNDIIAQLHPEVLDKYYGCGLAVPEFLEGAKVLDVGCGGGRDVFIISKLVGATGEVVGVDMTEDMLATAIKHADYHAEIFGFPRNTRFVLAKMEDLDSHLQPETFDIAISNCVMNLVASKEEAFRQIYRVLKPGGEFYFSDVYAAQPVPLEAQKNPLAWNECLSGALPWDSFVELSERIGFSTPFICSSADYEASHPDLEVVLKGLRFWSRTVRLVKPMLKELTYDGRLKHNEEGFNWDEEHHFPTGKPVKVHAGLAGVIMGSRYSQFFSE